MCNEHEKQANALRAFVARLDDTQRKVVYDLVCLIDDAPINCAFDDVCLVRALIEKVDEG